MWHPIRCNKEGNPLYGKQLWLFRDAFGVHRGERCVAKQKGGAKQKGAAKRQKT
jgi:hypothetical protein